jgi:hypothetical protein
MARAKIEVEIKVSDDGQEIKVAMSKSEPLTLEDVMQVFTMVLKNFYSEFAKEDMSKGYKQ